MDNRASALPDELIGSRTAIVKERIFPLTVGKTYVVYALTVWRGHLWYYLLDDLDLDYPVWQPAPLFEVVDGTLPSSWRIAYHRGMKREDYPLVSFAEWANDPGFYERLVDNDEAARRVFAARREEIDASHST